ncbi:MAG: acyl-CoA thioesterase, partial [Acidobacteriota bacterium]
HRVPWADIDLAGIVYYPRFLSYFEMAELEWVRSQGVAYQTLLKELGIWMPRVAAHCNYHAPARLADLIAIEMKLRRLGRTSFTLGYDAYLLPVRRHLADGFIVIATVSRSSFKPVQIPRRLRKMLDGLRLTERRRKARPGARKK